MEWVLFVLAGIGGLICGICLYLAIRIKIEKVRPRTTIKSYHND